MSRKSQNRTDEEDDKMEMKQESLRLEALHSYRILDTEREKSFDSLVELAVQITGAPMALISLIDERRQWVKASKGISMKELPRSLSWCAKTMENGAPIVIENTLKDERAQNHPYVTGGPKIRAYTGVPLVDAEGFALGALCVLHVTPWKPTQAQLDSLAAIADQVMSLIRLRRELNLRSEAERRFHLAAMNASDLVYEWNIRTGQITWFGDVEKYLGTAHSKFQMISDFWKTAIHPQDSQRVIRKVLKALHSDEHFRDSYRVLTPEGEVRHFTDSGCVLRNRQGHQEAWIGVLSDVTDRIRSSEQISMMKGRLEMLLNESPVVIYSMKANTQPAPSFVGENIMQVLGYSAEDFRKEDRFISARIHPADRDECERKMLDFVSDGKVSMRYRLRHANGSYVWIFDQLTLLRDAEGRPAEIVGSWTNIDEQMTLKEKLLKQEEESERLLQQQQMKMISSARLSSLGEMAGGIAHEINNPLAIIHGRAVQMRRTLEQNGADGVTLDGLSKIEQTAIRISKIVKGLRSFARNADREAFSLTSVSTILNDTLDLCRERFKNHDVQIRLSEIPQVHIECRAVQISQVLLNLLSNAYDAIHGMQDRWVEVSTRMVGRDIEIRVTDSGAGIPAEVREKLMQPFFTTKEVGKGTGLGLSISKGLIEDHGGRIVYDENDMHTSFVITLPISQEKGVA